MKKLLLTMVCLMLSMPVWAQDVKIDIKEFMFGPKDMTVAVGTKVTWVNDDEIPHTVAETHKVFRSGALDTNDSFSYVFNTPGEFEYFCALHPQMIGKIVVSQ
ncbi:cupredoxin domain-containing protein [Pseudomonas nunensis]|uniref:Cupredoxin family copper-binding protein n=1 Tax=Pseudomonas nunensis TaxID=2961896 RepID=A0ABY5EAU8_9PSED|nr:cupredoxin family copper-binding protein [Pseudomonas nunensis]KPN91676.1 amidase [Pseudomonas nunensis]MCL5229628.1 cupredoxin family copper-binding protein [Pseudomonas nunensis]UTO11880.1 cupredoxin family copper-binding protein [Pseudomonas nunensis]